MKKISVLLLTIIMILQIPVLAYANTDESILDSSKKVPNDIQTISYIEKTIDMNKNEIKVLKNKGVFDNFIDEVSVEMDKYVSLNSNEVLNQISRWGISPKCTVSDIEIEAQKYLNKYFDGIKIGSNEFKEMVHKYIDNEDISGARITYGAFACTVFFRPTVNTRAVPDDWLKGNLLITRKSIPNIDVSGFENIIVSTDSNVIYDNANIYSTNVSGNITYTLYESGKSAVKEEKHDYKQ